MIIRDLNVSIIYIHIEIYYFIHMLVFNRNEIANVNVSFQSHHRHHVYLRVSMVIDKIVGLLDLFKCQVKFRQSMLWTKYLMVDFIACNVYVVSGRTTHTLCKIDQSQTKYVCGYPV